MNIIKVKKVNMCFNIEKLNKMKSEKSKMIA